MPTRQSTTSSARPRRRAASTWPPRWLTTVPPADRRRKPTDRPRTTADDLITFMQGSLSGPTPDGFCRVTKDSIAAPAGQVIGLYPWQRNLITHLYARRRDGKLKHRQALIGVARKNGKSALAAGLGLHGLVTGPSGGEVYSCAADKEQARIVFGTAKRMVELDDRLAARLTIQRDSIQRRDTGSIWRVLSAEAFTKEGLNPHLVIFDEVHAQPNRELWDVMALAMGARPEPLMIGITTAGVRSDSTGGDSLCYGLYQYGKKVALGEVTDPTFFMAWWEPEDLMTDHRLVETWREANPGFAELVAEEDFESAVRRTPEPEFRALDSLVPILTPSGWVKMADLAAGDYVYAQDGSPTQVIGTSEVFTDRDCFRVAGTDGREVVADAEHWWPVETYDLKSNQREFRWVTTRWIYDNPSVTKYLLPGGAVDSPNVDLPIDPYVLGMWLGDGTAAAPVITAHPKDVSHITAEIEAAGYFSTVRVDATASRVYVSTSPVKRHGRTRFDTLRGRLVTSGLLGSKHVPESYLLASKAQRLALLQGLCDTDGTVAAGRVRFTNTNALLAEAVLYLARSLGWKPTLRVKQNRFGVFYEVAWTAYRDRPDVPFRMARKAGQLNAAPANRTRAERIKIEAVPVPSRPTRCIAVDDPSHTFLAGEHLMPTGNTKRCNQWVSTATTWLPHGAWNACAVDRAIEPYSDVILGFDGSFSNDSTALVAVQVGDVPHVDVVACWERPQHADNGWRVPIADVEQAIRDACRMYSVQQIVCDPFRWARTYQALEAEGLPVMEFPQSPARMVPATQRFYEAVLNRGLTHSGDPRLARHMENCTLKVDVRGARLAKDAKNSPRKIDLAVSAVMAYARACVTPAPTSEPSFAFVDL